MKPDFGYTFLGQVPSIFDKELSVVYSTFVNDRNILGRRPVDGLAAAMAAWARILAAAATCWATSEAE